MSTPWNRLHLLTTGFHSIALLPANRASLLHTPVAIGRGAHNPRVTRDTVHTQDLQQASFSCSLDASDGTDASPLFKSDARGSVR
jgi:hypothetical protein